MSMCGHLVSWNATMASNVAIGSMSDQFLLTTSTVVVGHYGVKFHDDYHEIRNKHLLPFFGKFETCASDRTSVHSPLIIFRPNLFFATVCGSWEPKF